MEEDIIYLLKLNNKILRATQVYLDKVLKEYNLSSGSYPYLLILMKNEGINQHIISEELDRDKAMSARTISKLINLGYIVRKKDENDSRSNKLYLTEKAKIIVPKIHHEIRKLINLMTNNLNEDEKIITLDSLNKILKNLKNI